MASSNTNLWVMLGLGLAGTILLMTRKLKRAIMPDFGAFIQKLELLPPPQPAPPKAPHPLTDLTFAVSDLYVVLLFFRLLSLFYVSELLCGVLDNFIRKPSFYWEIFLEIHSLIVGNYEY